MKTATTRVESSADVSAAAELGEGTSVWHLAQVREGAVLGRNCTIGRGAYVGAGVHVGDNCKLQNYALVYEPAILEDGVFVGPAAVFTNDQYPRAITPAGDVKTGGDWEPVGVVVRRGASIGARAVCVAPVTIGAWALVAAGAVVVANVPDYALVAGVPARRVGWVGRAGLPLTLTTEGFWCCPETGERYTERGEVLTLDLAVTTVNYPTPGVASNKFIPPAKPLIGNDERSAVDRVMRSGMLAQGPEVAAFEVEFAQHFGLDRVCVAVSSGTAGLHLGLLAAGVKPGDEIIVPSFTFAATANSVALAGAIPVFADIDPASFCLDPASVEASITERTVGVMPVHLYGHPADMPALQSLATRHGLQIFEDAAQAHGASLGGTPVGVFGSFAMFSLYPTKNMTAGEGGMVSVVNSSIERLMRLYRNQGMERQYENEIIGFNTRMTDIHAAIGRVQLTKIDAWTKQRQENAAYLSRHLEGVVTPPLAVGAVHVYHQYTVRVPQDRDRFAQALRTEFNVGSGIFYSRPNHRLASFDMDIDLPNTTQAAAECLSLPVHPSLTTSDLDRVITAVNTLSKAGV